MTTTTAPAPPVANAAGLRPGWFSTIATKRNKGEAIMFLVWGSIDDYVQRGYSATRFVGDVLAGTRERPGVDVVVRYSVDEGITFKSAAMERMYRTTLGLDKQPQAAGGDDDMAAAQAALRAATGAPEPGALPTDPDEAIAQILDFLKLARPQERGVKDSPAMVDGGARHAAAIIERLDLMLPAADKATLPPSRLRLIGRLHRASLDRELLANLNPIVMLAPMLEEVHQELRTASSGMRSVEIPLPDKPRRQAFVEELIAAGEITLEPGLTPSGLASITAGLQLTHIEDIAMLARGGVLTRKMALDRQGELMKLEYSDGLTRLEPTSGYETLYGVDYLADWFRQWVISPMGSDDPETKEYCPMGVGLIGPPGTAKTVFTKATAYEAQVNAVELSLTKSKWQGESARNLAKQIRGIKAFTPTIVLVDEYDKFLAGSEGGDGDSVNAELRKMWQEFTGDGSHRGEILLLVASNYPQNILPALARKGRIDYWAPMLAPSTVADRAAILVGHLKRRGFSEWTPESPEAIALAERTPDWTGADLEAAIIKALGLVKIMGMPIGEAVAEAVDTLMPTDPVAVDRMTKSAMRFANDLSLLPPSRREEARKVRQEPPDEEATGERPPPVRRQAASDLEL